MLNRKLIAKELRRIAGELDGSELPIQIIKKMIGKSPNSQWTKFEKYSEDHNTIVVSTMKLSDEQKKNLRMEKIEEDVSYSLYHDEPIVYLLLIVSKDGTSFNEIKLQYIEKRNGVINDRLGFATESGDNEEIGTSHTFNQIWNLVNGWCKEVTEEVNNLLK